MNLPLEASRTVSHLQVIFTNSLLSLVLTVPFDVSTINGTCNTVKLYRVRYSPDKENQKKLEGENKTGPLESDKSSRFYRVGEVMGTVGDEGRGLRTYLIITDLTYSFS